MKHKLVLLTALLLCGLLSGQETRKRGMKAAEDGLPPDGHELKIGDVAPDFFLKGVDARNYTLADFKDAKLLMVVFLSNHCPYSHAAETRLLPFAAQMKPRGLTIVAINPNHPDAVRVDELGYSKYNDSYEEMKVYAKEQRFTFPYLYDGETQSTAKAYGCLATPHVFLFDRDRHLRYKGRFDDSRFADAATVTSSDARNAVEALLGDLAVPVEVTPPMGCSTKWRSNQTEIARVEEQWNSTPIFLESLDAAGAATLARNDTKRLRLINVWATWCSPCVKEFPGLVSLSRRLSNRDFELITISVDDPGETNHVHQFLTRQHAAASNRLQRSLKSEGRKTNNYLFTGANPQKLMEALTPLAAGPVPLTVLIAPGGKLVYHQSGQVDAAELQAKVLEELGPYYER